MRVPQPPRTVLGRHGGRRRRRREKEELSRCSVFHPRESAALMSSLRRPTQMLGLQCPRRCLSHPRAKQVRVHWEIHSETGEAGRAMWIQLPPPQSSPLTLALRLLGRHLVQGQAARLIGVP